MSGQPENVRGASNQPLLTIRAQSKNDLTRKYEKLLQGVWKLKEERALSAAVYTQLTDVETEANGLMTYDRAVIKVDVDRPQVTARARKGYYSEG
jgi:hypothetical protein